MKIDPQKKHLILESAINVFSEKGFSEATISEIAKGAGLSGPGLYKYYSGKEEIYFAIIENLMVEGCTELIEHLQGIEGAENKLRKAIWFHCKKSSSNRSVAKIVLEARSYPRFYQSTAYEALKEYASNFTRVITEGMDENVFYGLPSAALLRDMIIGTVDHIVINWTTMKDVPNPLDQVDALIRMVLDAVRSIESGKHILSNKDKKRARILNVATELFAEKGFNDTSMLEIAKKADVAEGTVYEYFGNKESLLVGIPGEKLSDLYNNLSGNLLEKKLGSLISKIFQFFFDEKNYTTILVLMLRTNKRFHQSESSIIIDDLFDLIKEVIVKGQKRHLFKPDLDMTLCQHRLFGTVDHIVIPWIMFNRDYDFMKIGKEVADLFINAIKT